jgi:hypothetical protein
VTGLTAPPGTTRSAADRHAAARVHAGGRTQPPTPRRHRPSPRGQRLSLGVAPALALLAAGGLVLVALGNNAARESAGSAQPLFWGGLVLIYAPIAFRLLSVSASRAERISLAVILGASFFLVKVLYSPTGAIPYDELAAWRQTHDLLQTGHAFSSNPLALGYPGFPGLETVTAAVAQLADLSIFHAGLVVIGLARVTLMLALFLFLERVTRSPRAAGIGVAVYACNPSFLYFDSQFGHESLALLIGAALLLVAVRWSDPNQPGRPPAVPGLVGAMAVLACTLTITHHMTSYALLIFFVAWAALTALADRATATNGPREAQVAGNGKVPANGSTPSAARRTSLLDGPGLPALLMVGMAGVWFTFVAGGGTMAELGAVFTGTIKSILHMVFGGGGAKTVFAGSGRSNSLAARALAVGSIIPLLVLIPFGLSRTWKGRNSSPLWRALAVAAVLYPVTLGLRLTQSGTETSQRASEFVFIGLAFFAAIVVSQLRWPERWLRRSAKALGLTAVATVVFLGGFIVAQLPATRQPGSFLISAEARSVSPQGLAAARFAASSLPAESRILVDRPNATLLGSYGDLNPVLGNKINGIPVARVFFSKRFDRADRRVIIDDAIDYILVDRRLSRALPVIGYYFQSGEPGAFTRKAPISASSLSKFSHVRGLSRVFANGAIAIYDTSGLRQR